MLRLKLLIISIFFIQFVYAQDSTDVEDKSIIDKITDDTYTKDTIISKKEIKTIGELYRNKKAFPVVIDGDTIFNTFEQGPLTSISDHAKLCRRRLQELLKQDVFYRDSIAVKDSADFFLVTYSGSTIIEFGEKTNTYFHKDPSYIGDTYMKELGDYLEYREPGSLWKKLMKVLIYIAIYIGSFILMKFIYHRIIKWVNANDQIIYTITRKLKIYSIKEEDKLKAVDNFLLLIKWLYWAIIAFYTYMILPTIFSVFYFTKSIGDKMFGYVFDPFMSFIHSFIDYIPNFINIVVILFIFKVFIKAVNFIFSEIERGNINVNGFYTEWAKPTGNIVKLFLYAFLVTIIFPLLPGSGSDVFKGVTMFLGLIFSLGSTSVISNAFSGLVMTYMRPFQIGDRIEADDVTGIVVQKNLLITRVRTPKNVIVTIPNAKILSGHSKNFSTAAERSNLVIHSTITIGYDIDWRTIHKLLIAAAKNTNGLIEQSGKEAFVLQKSLDDFYVAYEINAYTAMADKYVTIQSELHKNILDEFNKANVEIMSPHYRVNRSGEDVTIPNKTAQLAPQEESILH